MPTSAQLAALANYAAARKDYADIEASLLVTLAASSDTNRALNDALGRGDEFNADLLRAQIAAIDERTKKTLAARTKELQALASARDAALAGGAGFDLVSARHPLLLLPVRLEARFAWMDGRQPTFSPDPALEQVLLVRVYPDEIHEDSHDPQVTADEFEALAEFRKKLMVVRDLLPLKNAWKELAARVGATRAGWIGESAISLQKPGRRPARFSRPSIARLLPDRWVAVAELEDGSLVSGQSNPVSDPLEMGASPDAIAWVTDFVTAAAAGMTVTLRNLPAGTDVVRRLRVIGVRGTLGPTESQVELETLLRAHQFTRGFELIAPGTPTNSLPGARSGYASRPSPEDIVEVNQRRYLIGGASSPLCQPGDRSDGSALAFALGIDIETLGFVKRADATDQYDAQNVRRLLAFATERALVRHLSDVVDPSTVRELLGFGAERVSALGPLPAFRVGPQPYGILPVLRRDASRLRTGFSAARYLPMLERLRAVWESATARVERVGRPGADPSETLIRILQQDAIAQRIAFRPFLSRDLSREALAGIEVGEERQILRRRERAVEFFQNLMLDAPEQAALIQALHLPIAPPLAAPLIEPPDAPGLSMQLASQYLELVATLRVDALYRHDYPGAERPKALLFAIARLAMLEMADARARELLIASGADPTRWDDEDLPNHFLDYFASMQRRLESQDPLDPLAPFAFHLSESGREAYVLSPVRTIVRDLKARPAVLLEELLRASLCLFSGRLDAWYTALATEELEVLRSDPSTANGLNAGAWGVLEEIRRSPRAPVSGQAGVFTNPLNGGYIHAPSVNQGAAAAMLRSVHLAHAADGHGAAFSVDLSSARVRRGLELSEGIRSGQPLAALLGYRIERELRAEKLARFIAPLRRIAPLIANRLTPSTLPAESVAAGNVIDGLTLLEQAGYDGRQAASVLTLWTRQPSLGPALSRDEQTAFTRVLSIAQEGVDALADLTLAESVYQAVQGNPMRTGAALDAVSGAPVPPAEFTILKTPRSGIGVTHRLVVLLGDGSPADVPGWSDTPRVAAEPRLERWARSLLPPPSQIGLRARFEPAKGDAVWLTATLKELLDDAQAHASHLGLGALDLVALADPNDAPQGSALETRLSALLERMRPPEARDARLVLRFDRDAAWDATVFGVGETQEIAKGLRDLLGLARPLGVDDLARAGRSSGSAYDPGELAARASAAAGALATVKTELTSVDATDADAVRRVLFRAESLGIAGAAPASIRDHEDDGARAGEVAQLDMQRTTTLSEAIRRQASLDAIAADDSVARIKAIFGEGFVVLPTLLPPDSVTSLFDASAAPTGGDEPAARAWLGRAARVREHVGKLDEILGSADAVVETQTNTARPQLRVAQTGGAPGERWVALPLAPNTQLPGGRVSIVAVVHSSNLPTKHVAGLMVDEWVEVVPASSETTSLAFHYDAPTSTPPQVLLLGLPYPAQETWTPGDVLEIVDEALALARLRMVDTSTLPGLGQLVPLFVTAENPTGELAGLDVERLTESETP